MAEQVLLVHQERNQQYAREQLRKRLEQHARHINNCDGAVREQLREWMEAVSAAMRWTSAGDDLTIEMVGYLSKGSLRTSIADFVDAENNNGRASRCGPTLRLHFSMKMRPNINDRWPKPSNSYRTKTVVSTESTFRQLSKRHTRHRS